MTLISKRTDLSGSLPTKLVDDSQIFGKLVYVNRPFYEFYAYMEKLCSLFLCTHNLVLNGNSIVQETKELMHNSIQLKYIFTSVVLDVIDYVLDESDSILVYSYFINLFIQMRGKNYCRQYMTSQGISLAQSLRPTLAKVTSQNRTVQKQYNNNNHYHIDDVDDVDDANNNSDTNNQYHNSNNDCNNDNSIYE